MSVDFHFNHRIARKKREYILNDKIHVSYEYFIVEAFYDKNGKVWGCSQEPRVLYGETLDDLAGAYIQFRSAFYAPILDFDNIPEEGAQDRDNEQNALLEKLEDALMEEEENDAILDGDDLRCSDEEIEKYDREQEELRVKAELNFNYLIKEYENKQKWKPDTKLINIYRQD